MQKPTRVYMIRAHTNNDIRGRTKYTPWASTTALFLDYRLFGNFSGFYQSKQALVNAI